MLLADDHVVWSEHVSLAQTCQARGERALAMQHYQLAAGRNSECSTAWLALGEFAFEAGDLKTAEADYRKALKIMPKNPVAINNLARVYLAQGKDLNGIDIMVEDTLENAGPLAPYLCHTLALINLRAGRFADARL